MTNFRTAQHQDPTLQQARADVQVVDGTPINDGMIPNSFPHFIMKNGLVYRVSKIGVDVVEQLLVPTRYRRTVLDLAHGHILGGHLGIDKTRDQIAGGVIIGLGLMGQFVYHGSTSEFENQSKGFVMLYVVGGITMVMSLLGAYGAHREKRIPLIMFLVAPLVLGCSLSTRFSTSSSSFIVCFCLLCVALPTAMYRPEVKRIVEEKFREVLPLNEASPDVRQLTERIQLNLKCCGLFSYTDWGNNVPDSCLCQGEEDQMEGTCLNIPYQLFLSEFRMTGHQKLIYKQTCFPIIEGYVAKALDILLGASFGFAALALLGAVMSAVLLAQLRSSTVAVPVVFSVSSHPSKFSFSSHPPKYSELYNEPEKHEK
ncbi:CD63 antigen-like [Salmo salar]|uniref:CD63 antigen-like n=1 Tax=Salmo salar TaxID=8030 RepID=A0A1S3M072_SALSA|nr:CD63 antigen-like [Salmo salar]